MSTLQTKFPATQSGSSLLNLELPVGVPERLDLQNANRWLYDLSAAGVAISGDSGSGKSVLLRQSVATAVDTGTSIVVIDPHGDLVDAIHRDCLARGPAVRNRVLYLAPGRDDLPIGPLNPLGTDPLPGETPYGFRARLDCRAVHCAHLTINCSGDSDFDQKPQLFRWLTNIFRALALMGLSMADGLRFLDFESEMFGPLVDAIPDELLQSEFRLLASMSPAEREVFCGSTRARLNNLFSNIVLQCHLGVPRGAINVRQLIQDRTIVLLNLAHCGRLDENYHAPILANLWVAEILHTVFSTPQEQRLPLLLVLDELPVFRASAKLLTSALRQVRKMQLRFLLAFQGIHSFPLAKDDPLLRATSMCGSSFYFRHTDEDDALFFGGKVSLPEYDPLRPKFVHWDKEQYQDGYDFITLTDQSWQRAYSQNESAGTSDGTNWQENWSKATGYGTDFGRSVSRTENWSSGTSINQSRSTGTRIQQAVGETFGHGGGSSQSQTLSNGSSEQSSHTDNASRSDGASQAHSEQHSSGTQEAEGQNSSTGSNRSRTTNRDQDQQVLTHSDAKGANDARGTSQSHGRNQSEAFGNTVTQTSQTTIGTADSTGRGTNQGIADQAGTISSWDAKQTSTKTSGTDKSRSEGTSVSEGVGGAIAEGESSSENWQETNSIGGAQGISRTMSRERGRSETQGSSITEKQTPLARVKWRRKLQFVEFLSREEQKVLSAAKLSSMPTGQALHQIAGHSVRWVQVDLPEESWADAPVTLKKALRSYFERIRTLDVYHDPVKILERQKQLREQLWEVLLGTSPTINLPAVTVLPSTQAADDSPFSI